MKKIYLALILLFFLASFDVLLNEMIYGRFYYSNPWLELSLYLLLILPIFFFKSNRYSWIYTGVVGFIFSFLVFLNLAMFECSGDVFSFSYFVMAGAAGAVFNWSYMPWKSIAFSFLIDAVATLLFVGMHFFTKSRPDKLQEKVKHPVTISGALTILFLVANITSMCLVQDSSGAGRNPFETINFITQTQKKQSLGEFGLLNYGWSDLLTTVNPGLGGENKTDPENPRHETSTQQGKCENFNVVTIMVETGCNYLVNETLTPNLWALMQDSIDLTNNVSKNKTNMSEFIGITGIGGRQDAIQSGEVVDCFSLPNRLKEKGYTTAFFHDNDKNFYNRGEEILNLGFEKTYFANDLNPEVIESVNRWNGSYPLDSEFVDLTLDQMVPIQEEPFYTFYTTFSMHGPYGFSCPNFSKFQNLGYYARLKEAEEVGLWENVCLDDPLAIQQQIEYLQCATMDFDVALGKIVASLRNKGLYENTIIAVYGDHDSYYKSGKADKMLSSYVYDVEDNDVYLPERYKTVNFIANPTLKKAYCQENGLDEVGPAPYSFITSPYVLVPTLLDVLRMDYDPYNYLGVSIFRTDTKYDNLFYSHELQFFMSEEFVSISDKESGIQYQKEGSSPEDLTLFREKISEIVELIFRFNNAISNGGFH